MSSSNSLVTKENVGDSSTTAKKETIPEKERADEETRTCLRMQPTRSSEVKLQKICGGEAAETDTVVEQQHTEVGREEENVLVNVASSLE